MASGSAPSSLKLRSAESIYDVDVYELCPEIQNFNKHKLPTIKEVIGLVRHRQSVSKVGSYDTALRQVAEELRIHWISHNVYPITKKSVVTRLQKTFNCFRKLSRTDISKRKDTWLEDYEDFKATAGKLFDIFNEDESQRKKLEDQYGVPMMDDEYDYLQSMRSDRKAECRGKDSKWHRDEEKNKSQRQDYINKQNSSFQTVTANDLSGQSEDSDDNQTECDSDFIIEHSGANESPPAKKKFSYKSSSDKSDSHSHIATRSSATSVSEPQKQTDPIPRKYRHIRDGLRGVRDEVYQTMAELEGHGFSYRQAQLAIMIVGNTLFSREWKLPHESDNEIPMDINNNTCEMNKSVIDDDTLPTKAGMKFMLRLIEASSLNLVAKKIVQAKEDGAVITHSTDSTTRKYVGSYATAGVHINKDAYLPLSTLQMANETTDNIADGVIAEFEMLAAASDYDAQELYDTVDCHMTDATAHNKGKLITKVSR